MNLIIKAIVLMNFLIFTTPSLLSAQDFLKDGKLGYENRAKDAVGLKANPATINEAIANLEKALALGISPEETGIYLIRSYNFKARFVETKSSEKIKMFEKGIVLGEKLVKQFPKSEDLLFEYLCIVGYWAKEINPIKAAWDGALGKMKNGADKLYAMNPGCGGYRSAIMLGVMYIKAPYIPVVLTWPNNKAGLDFLKKAYKCSPNDFGGLFFYGFALDANNERAKGRAYLEKIMTMSPRKELLLEDRIFLRDAENLLKEWK